MLAIILIFSTISLYLTFLFVSSFFLIRVCEEKSRIKDCSLRYYLSGLLTYRVSSLLEELEKYSLKGRHIELLPNCFREIPKFYIQLNWKELSPQDQSWLWYLASIHSNANCLIKCIEDSKVQNLTWKEKLSFVLRVHLVDELALIGRDSKAQKWFSLDDEIINSEIALEARESILWHAILYYKLMNETYLKEIPIQKFEKIKVPGCSKNLLYNRLKEREKELMESLNYTNITQIFLKVRKMRIASIQNCSKRLLEDTKCDILSEMNPKRKIGNLFLKMDIFSRCGLDFLQQFFNRSESFSYHPFF